MKWFERIFQTQQLEDNNRTIETAINELLLFLNGQITNKQKGKGLIDDTALFSQFDYNKKIEYLPEFYLSYEQFLTEIDDSPSFTVISLRKMVQSKFEGLLELKNFRLIFESLEKQSIILCRDFITSILSSSINILGATQNDWLFKILDWLQLIPDDVDVNALPFSYDGKLETNEQWITFFKRCTNVITETIEKKVGIELTKSIIEKSYNKIAKSYRVLEVFPTVVVVIPERFLNAEKIGLLSKHQLGKILLDKANNLEELNNALSEKNKSLLATQSQLEESNTQIEATFRQLSAVLNTVNDCIITADDTGKIILVNKAVRHVFGYTEAELFGQNLTVIMPEEYRNRHLDEMNRHLETNTSRVFNKTIEMRALHKNGATFPIEINISKAYVDGKIIFTAAIKDITARKKMENELKHANELLEEKVAQRTQELSDAQLQLKEMVDELERSNKELEDFAYIVSHDLQEPLRMISSFLQILNKKYVTASDEKAKSYIGFAVSGAGRMKQLIRDLLEYSRVGRGAAKFERIEVSILTLLQHNIFKRRLEKLNGTLTFSGVEAIVADKTMITQLLQNLIGNAIKFHRVDVPPIIEVNIETSDKHWLFSVTDNGIGIDEKFQEKIFAVFQRLHHQDQYEGTGIGLAICKKIIDGHKGKIWVESELGEGTTFYFTIPKVIQQ